MSTSPKKPQGDHTQFDFTFQSDSPALGAGGPLTTVAASGSGNIIPVDDAGYFFSGFGVTSGDIIRIKDQIAQITKVDYVNNTITVKEAIAYTEDEPIYFTDSQDAPNVGALITAIGVRKKSKKGTKKGGGTGKNTGQGGTGENTGQGGTNESTDQGGTDENTGQEGTSEGAGQSDTGEGTGQAGTGEDTSQGGVGEDTGQGDTGEDTGQTGTGEDTGQGDTGEDTSQGGTDEDTSQGGTGEESEIDPDPQPIIEDLFIRGFRRTVDINFQVRKESRDLSLDIQTIVTRYTDPDALSAAITERILTEFGKETTYDQMSVNIGIELDETVRAEEQPEARADLRIAPSPNGNNNGSGSTTFSSFGGFNQASVSVTLSVLGGAPVLQTMAMVSTVPSRLLKANSQIVKTVSPINFGITVKEDAVNTDQLAGLLLRATVNNQEVGCGLVPQASRIIPYLSFEVSS